MFFLHFPGFFILAMYLLSKDVLAGLNFNIFCYILSKSFVCFSNKLDWFATSKCTFYFFLTKTAFTRKQFFINCCYVLQALQNLHRNNSYCLQTKKLKSTFNVFILFVAFF